MHTNAPRLTMWVKCSEAEPLAIIDCDLYDCCRQRADCHRGDMCFALAQQIMWPASNVRGLLHASKCNTWAAHHDEPSFERSTCYAYVFILSGLATWPHQRVMWQAVLSEALSVAIAMSHRATGQKEADWTQSRVAGVGGRGGSGFAHVCTNLWLSSRKCARAPQHLKACSLLACCTVHAPFRENLVDKYDTI